MMHPGGDMQAPLLDHPSARSDTDRGGDRLPHDHPNSMHYPAFRPGVLPFSGGPAVPPPPTRKLYNSDETFNMLGWGRYQWGLMFLCGSTWAVDAAEMLLVAFLMPTLQAQWNIGVLEESSLGGLTFFGMMIGAAFWGVIGDKYGRRIGTLAVTGITGVCGLASAFSPNIWGLMALRFLVGIGLGGAPVSFSLFAEMIPGYARGRTLTLIQGGFWTIGTIFTAALAWAVVPTMGWRWFLGFSSIPVLISFVCFIFFMPESPRFLLVSGKHEAAERAIRRVAEVNRVKLPEGFGLLPYRPSAEDVRGRASLLELFKPEYRLITLLVWVIWACDNFAYYGASLITPKYFNTVSSDEYMATFLTAVAQIPALVAVFFMVDRVGRKITIAVMFFLTALGLALLLLQHVAPTWFLILAAVIARGAAQGAFTATYVYTPEVYGTVVRSTALGSASAISRLAGIGTSYIAVGLGSPNDFLIPVSIFGSTALLGVLAALLLPVDTSGRQMSDSIAETGMHLVRNGRGVEKGYDLGGGHDKLLAMPTDQ